MSSLRSATICWRSIERRTAPRRSRRRAAFSNSSVRRRLAHLLVEALDDRRRVPVEELAQLLDELAVGGLVDLADARTGALLDVEQQARPAEALVLLELVPGCTCGSGTMRNSSSSVSRIA